MTMVMRKHVPEESARRAPPTVHWSIVHLPERQLAHPWPFPVSVTADGKLVRNAQPAESAPAPKKPRGKPPGSVVKLRVVDGDMPPQGCVLQLGSGRRYLVQAWVGCTIWVVVLDPAEKLKRGTLVLPWFWVSRRGTLERREVA